MMLYQYRRSDKGRQKGEFPLGSLDWDGSALQLKVRDRTLRERIRDHFQQSFWVPLPLGDEEHVLGHTWEKLEPGDEEHFLEGVRRLPQLEVILMED